MVIRPRHFAKQRGFLMTDLAMAMGIMLIVFMPICYSVKSDAKLFRLTYQRAVAMEIVDGEMEILAAGAWRNVAEGTHPYTISAGAEVNLPPGQFQLTRTGRHLRLEWLPAKSRGAATLAREVTLP